MLVFLFIGVLFADPDLVLRHDHHRRHGRAGCSTSCVGAFRWGYRVYAYVFLLTDEYPPFSLEDDPNYPVRVEIDYPEQDRPLAAAGRTGC